MPGWWVFYFFFGEEAEAVFECSVLVFEFDEFLLIFFEDVDFVLEVSDDDVLLVGLNLEGRVEVGRSLGGTHALVLN